MSQESGESVLRGKRTNEMRARFEAVALPHLEAVYRMARRLGKHESEADDLTQETFVRAFRGFQEFELRDYGAKPWLLKILQNVFYSKKGKEKRQPSLLGDVDFDRFASEIEHDPLIASDFTRMPWDAMDEEIKRGVEALPGEYQTVLLLWAMENLSYKEIAEICQIPIGTVMSRLYRARQIMGQRLGDFAARHNINAERFGR